MVRLLRKGHDSMIGKRSMEIMSSDEDDIMICFSQLSRLFYLEDEIKESQKYVDEALNRPFFCEEAIDDLLLLSIELIGDEKEKEGLDIIRKIINHSSDYTEVGYFITKYIANAFSKYIDDDCEIQISENINKLVDMKDKLDGLCKKYKEKYSLNWPLMNFCSEFGEYHEVVLYMSKHFEECTYIPSWDVLKKIIIDLINDFRFNEYSDIAKVSILFVRIIRIVFDDDSIKKAEKYEIGYLVKEFLVSHKKYKYSVRVHGYLKSLSSERIFSDASSSLFGK